MPEISTRPFLQRALLRTLPAPGRGAGLLFLTQPLLFPNSRAR